MTIKTATANGARPGMVILDGLKRPSILITDDRSINIFVSDLALHDVDNAIISACDYGLFLTIFPSRTFWSKESPFNILAMVSTSQSLSKT